MTRFGNAYAKLRSMPNQLTSDQQTAIAQALEAFGGDTHKVIKALEDAGRPNRRRRAARHIALGDTIIKLQGVSRRYKMGKSEAVGAINDVSISISEHEFVAITGASGSGKSTLLNLIGGLDKPNAGTITVAGHDLTKLSDSALSGYRGQTIGFVFQFFYLQPFLTVSRNLEVPAMFSQLPAAKRIDRIRTLAEAVGLTDRLGHRPNELSGGQMQRAAIARALVNQPRILLADEPTGNLDSVNAEAIIDLFHEVRDTFGTTVIIVTHDAKIAAGADRVITMHDGKVAS